MNNDINEKWFESQKEKYTEHANIIKLKEYYTFHKVDIESKLKERIASKYNCNSFDEFEYILNNSKKSYYLKYINKINQIQKSIKLKNLAFFDREKLINIFKNDYKNLKIINYIKMNDVIKELFSKFRGFTGEYHIASYDFLTNSNCVKALIDVYLLGNIYYYYVDFKFWFGIELANYEKEILSLEEKQLLNLYNSLYDTYFEYYQKFVDTLPESEIKDAIQAIPAEYTACLNDSIKRKLFGEEKRKKLKRHF